VYAGLIGRFAAAFVVSSFAVFALAGAMGAAVGRALPPEVRLAVAGLVFGAAFLLDLHSLRRKTWCPLTLRRQTPKAILYEHGPRRAAVAWGLDTGLVFTTYRMSSISWALLALGLLGIAPWWEGIGYAAGFLVPLLVGCTLGPLWHGDSATTVLAQALAKWPLAARATSVAALAAALTAVGASLA
jgi:hypothetical protein